MSDTVREFLHIAGARVGKCADYGKFLFSVIRAYVERVQQLFRGEVATLCYDNKHAANGGLQIVVELTRDEFGLVLAEEVEEYMRQAGQPLKLL